MDRSEMFPRIHQALAKVFAARLPQIKPAAVPLVNISLRSCGRISSSFAAHRPLTVQHARLTVVNRIHRSNLCGYLKDLLDGTAPFAAAQCWLIWRPPLNLTFFFSMNHLTAPSNRLLVSLSEPESAPPR